MLGADVGTSIAVLIADRKKRKAYETALARLALPSGLKWGNVDSSSSNTVTLESVARYKGLESQVIILWGLDHLLSEDKSKSLYIGISRAKSILAICGQEETCTSVLIGT